MDPENAVRKYRTRQKRTQEELAAQVGVSRQTIIAIEKGGYTPSVTLALKLAQVLSASVEALFWLENEEPKDEKPTADKLHPYPGVNRPDDGDFDWL